jgi:hypothetical protein
MDTGGGGISAWGGNWTISDNIISNNKADWGGGIYTINSGTYSIVNNIISDNYASTMGGGIYHGANSTNIVSGNSIIRNIADNQPAVTLGGASATYTYNTIIGNAATGAAPTFAIRLYAVPHFNHNNLYGNATSYGITTSTGSRDYTTNFDAANNWWGTVVDAEVQQGIYDWLDDNTLTRIIDYVPYATTRVIDAPIAPPTGLTVNSVQAGSVTLSWAANTESDTVGYKVYWGKSPGYPYANVADVGNVTTHSISGLTGEPIYVTVTAYDTVSTMDDPDTIINERQSAGHESWYAPETTVTFYTLAVAMAGDGSGTIVSSPAGIQCGSDCMEPYDKDTSVTLTAEPASGSLFKGWSGGLCPGTGTCTVTMDVAKSVTATFEKNQAPIANAGVNQIVYNAVTLDGTQSSDPDGSVSAYRWVLKHREDAAYDRSSTGATVTINNLASGFYDVSLMVTDNNGLESIASNMLLAVVPSATIDQVRNGWYSQTQLDAAVVSAVAQQTASLFTKDQLDQAILSEKTKWDVGGDNKIGLEEAIRALQIISGMR